MAAASKKMGDAERQMNALMLLMVADARPERDQPQAKRGRGRPRKAEPVPPMFGSLPTGAPDVGGRQFLNHFYSWRATGQFGDDPRLVWLFNGPGGKPRTGVLAELGRINDLPRRLEVAIEVCGRKLNAKDAEAFVRCRRGKSTKPAASALADRIAETVNTYVRSHVGTTPGMIRDALRDVLNRVPNGNA